MSSCLDQRRNHPILFIAISNPEVSQLETIVLSVWALPLAKLSAAVASRDQRRAKRPWCCGSGLVGSVSVSSSSEDTFILLLLVIFFARVEALCVQRMHKSPQASKRERERERETRTKQQNRKQNKQTTHQQTQPTQKGARFVPQVDCVSQWRRVKHGETEGQ